MKYYMNDEQQHFTPSVIKMQKYFGQLKNLKINPSFLFERKKNNQN